MFDVNRENTAVLITDPQNDFLSPDGAGLPLSDAHLAVWRACTHGAAYPAQPFGETTVLAGAHAGGGSRIPATQSRTNERSSSVI